MIGYRRELTTHRDLQVNQGITETFMDTHEPFYVDVRLFGPLGTPDDSATIQAAIDHAAGLPRGGRVVMPSGLYNCHNLRMKRWVDFVGQGMSTVLFAPAGSVGAMIKLDNPSVERMMIADLWIAGNRGAATTHGIDIDNAGGTFTGADPQIALYNIFVDFAGLDGFRLRSRALTLSYLRSRACGQDGFAFLTGTVATTDGTMTHLSSDASIRDGLRFESGFNMLSSIKVGEAGRYGISLESGANCNTFSSVLIDNTGYPTFAAGTPLRIVGVNNVLDGLAITRGGIGSAIELTSAAMRNVIRGSVLNFSASGLLNYAVTAPLGTLDNDIAITSSAMVLGNLDPVTDLARNRIAINSRGAGQELDVTKIADDFLGASLESGEIGALGWSTTGSTIAAVAGVASHPGIVNAASLAVPGTLGNLLLAATATGSPIVPTDVAYFAFVIRVPVNTAIDARIGVCQDLGTAGANGTAGATFIFATAVSANWIVATRQAGVSTNTTTGVAVAAGTWYKLEGYRQPGGSWEFWINGVLVATHATNLPTTACNAGVLVSTTDAAVKSVDVDAFTLTTKAIGNRY